MKLLLGIFFLFIISFSVKAQADWEEHSTKDYSIRYPSSYIFQKGSGIIDFIMFVPNGKNKALSDNLNLAIDEEVDTTLTFEEYQLASMDMIKQMTKGFKVIEKSEDITANLKYHKTVFKGKMMKMKMVWLQYSYLVDNTYYIFTFTTSPKDYEKLSPEVEDIFKTFIPKSKLEDWK